MAKKLTKEEREKLREVEAKKQKTKKIVYIVSFAVALVLGIVFTISSILNLYKLGEFEDDPLPPVTENIPDAQIDDIKDGKLIVYNPKTNISIIRDSMSLSHQAIDIIKYREEVLEHSSENSLFWVFNSMKVAGNNFTCFLPTNSKVNDSFVIKPDGDSDLSTIYTLYSQDERIEFTSEDINELHMRFQNGVCLYTDGGHFQCALLVGNKTIKFSANVKEAGIVAIDWEETKMIFDVQSNVILTDLKIIVKENNKTTVEFPIEIDCYGARVHLFGVNQNEAIPYTTPHLNELKGE